MSITASPEIGEIAVAGWGKKGGEAGMAVEDFLDEQAKMLGLKRLEKEEGRIHYELLDPSGRMFPW